MATLSLSDISDALSQLFEPQITSQINNVAVALNVLPTIVGSGKNAAWTAKFTGRSVGAGFTEGADMAAVDFDSEVRQDAILPWAQYRKGAQVSGLAQAAGASNQMPGSLLAEGVSDLFGDELGDANEKLGLGLGTDVFGGLGNAARPLIGLELAISAGAAVYATIDPAVRTEWVSTVQTVASGSFSFAKLRALLTAIYKASGKNCDLLLTDPDTFDKIGELFGDNRPYTQEIVLSDGSPMGRRTITLEAGYTALLFDGIPIVRDNLCTANTIYALNTRHVHIKQLPAYKSPMTEARFLDLMESITGERLPDAALGEFQSGPGSLKPYVEMLGQLGDADKAQVKVYCQLCVHRRNAHGKLTLT